MGIYYKNNFEFEIRDIGGSDVYYKRNIGDDIWLFSTKKEFEYNMDIMDKKYTQSDIERGAEIEMEHQKTIEEFMKDGTNVKDVARAISIDHLEENPLSYSDYKGVCMNESLMIRLFELMNEDIKSDVDLHKVAEKVITASKNKDILTMDDYESFLLNIPKEESYSIGGGVDKKEKSNRIECHNPNCDWSWSIESGGDDLYICHKCFTDNEKFYEKGGLIAPNGKPSKLTPEQYKLVRTSEFKEWFGDWENDPANASKVVDDNGEPLVVLHGSEGFALDYLDEKNNKIYSKDNYRFIDGRLIFTTDNKDVAKYFGNYKYYFVNIKNPFVIDGRETYYNAWHRIDEDFLIKTLGKQKFIEITNKEHHENFTYDEWLKFVTEQEALPISIDCISDYIKNNTEYDGVIAYDIEETTYNINSNDYIAFKSADIKLADGTNTTFDGSNPDIRFEDGGGIITNLQNYIKDIEVDINDEEGIMCSGEFGNDGSLCWVIRGEFITVNTIDSGNKKGGEGTMAIANLFLSNPKVKTITYQDHSHFQDGTSFWDRIGGDYSELDRSNFFKYFEKKYGYNPDIRFDDRGEVEDLISQGIVELKMFATKPEHAKEYGLDSINPLYVQSLNVNENKRLKGVGKKVLQYIDDYAIKNGHDVVFGHINKKATMTKDNRTGYFTVFTDIDYIKHWLFRNGYSVNQENNDFHKVVMSDSKDINDESKSDINFADGGSVANDKLVALHNINSNQIISADKLGGLITPSIAILKAGDKFTDFGSITLIADKNLVNPQNYDTRVFAGDVYSPTVPRKNIYVDKKKYDNVTLKLINKSFEYDKSKEVYHIANNLISDYSYFYKDLSKLSLEDLNKNYSDKMRIIYLVDKDIPVKIPMKESRHILWNNVEFTLTEEQKKRFKPVLDEYRKQSNESNLSKEIKSEVYDLMLEVLDDIKRDLKEKYKENTDRYEILKDSLKKSFEDYVGERYTFGDSPVYNLSEAVFGKKELNENQLNININKIFTKSLKEDYKQWLSDFITQFRGYSYFLKGNQKIPYTLDNLVDATSNAVVGQEKNMTFGVNQAKSFATKEFKTIDEMKKKSNVLITKEEMNVVDKENSDKFFQVADELKYVYSDSWNKLDSLGKALADYFKGKSVYNALVKNDFKSPNSFQEDSFLELANQLKNSPVDYFEAKLGRAVKLSEFKYAVVPYETEKQVLDILKKNDLKIKKYKTEEERIMVTKDILNKDKKITFEDGGKIQLNSNRGKVNLKLSNYEDVTELVPVSELLKLREFNRYERPKYSLDDSKDNISKLEDELVNNGVEEPLIIEYSLADNSVLLIEGNHRLNVADNLGFDYLPARVVLRRREFTPLQKTKAFKVKGLTPDKYGYVPSDLKPSQVGIGGTTKAFEDGGIVEGQLHSECNDETGCGEKYDVGGVGHIIEVERDEAVIVSKAFLINDEFEVKGTLSQIASALNVLGDGKNFDSGAEIKRQDGNKIEVSQIKKEAKDTDVETIDPNSIIINRRSMADKNIYIAKGTPKQIASQINNINDNGVKIVDGGSIQKT